MRLSEKIMFDRFMAGDAEFDGQFFTGVLTTGIYCLPSCRARKPKRENVQFYPSAPAARAAGFRACRKCHPDDFAAGADPVLEIIEQVAREVRADPAKFASAADVVRRTGFGPTRALELCKRHLHGTPADLLQRARFARAADLLREHPSRALTEVALDVGFASQSTFHDNFRLNCGLTPGAWRDLRDARKFTVHAPAGYPLAFLRRALGRDPLSTCEQLDGTVFSAVLRGPQHPVTITMDLASEAIAVTCPPGLAYLAHAAVAGWLGLGQDADGFARHATKLGLQRLVAGRSGLRVPQVPDIWDAMVWAIIGQQINLPFAFRMRRSLHEIAGTTLSDGRIAPPSPAQVAAIDPEALLARQFSRQKVDYLISTARAITAGRLDLEDLRRQSPTRAERTLLALRGFGPWSVNYVMMRALGHADCLPLGDTGVTSGLTTLYQLETKPDRDAVRALMAPFAPFRSLATAHLWQINQPSPLA